MAHDRAPHTGGPGEPHDVPDSGATPAAMPLPEVRDSMTERQSVSSVDQLLALTDEGWSIEEQVQTLKHAAKSGENPAYQGEGDRLPQIPPAPKGLHIPTPYELAPTLIPQTSPAHHSEGGTRAHQGAESDVWKQATAVDSSPPSVPSSGRPPPLPPRSGKPPPIPRKGPPPLPPHSQRPSPLSDGALRPHQADGSGRTHALSPEPSSRQGDSSQPATLIELLNARLATLEGRDSSGHRRTGAPVDVVSLARTHMELAIASETVLSDDVRATTHAEAALKVDPTLVGGARAAATRKHGRAALRAMLAHLEHEIAAATTEAPKVELLVETRAAPRRLGNQRSDRCARPGSTRWRWRRTTPARSRASRRSSSRARSRPASTARGNGRRSRRTSVRMADAYAPEPHLAAWLHVERAQILERRLGRVDAARGALERAARARPQRRPVRDALVRHAADARRLACAGALLDEEATPRVEPARGRAARARRRGNLRRRASATTGARRASCSSARRRVRRRAPTSTAASSTSSCAFTRPTHAGPRPRAPGERGFASSPTRPPSPTSCARSPPPRRRAATSTRQSPTCSARSPSTPTDPTLVETLDRLLATAGKHEPAHRDRGCKRRRAPRTRTERARRPSCARPASATTLGRPADAIAPPSLRLGRGAGRRRGPRRARAAPVARRRRRRSTPTLASLVELYAQAADQATDDGRKVAYLEKVALLWEELLGDPARAARAYEQVLELDPSRRGAILGLERTAARTGDARTLAARSSKRRASPTTASTRLALRTRAASALAAAATRRARIALVRDVLDRGPARHRGARRSRRGWKKKRAAGSSPRGRCARASTGAEVDAEKVGALARARAAPERAPARADRRAGVARASARPRPVASRAARGDRARARGPRRPAGAARRGRAARRRTAPTAEERARHLVRAAEIDELRLGDDASAHAHSTSARSPSARRRSPRRAARARRRRAALPAPRRADGAKPARAGDPWKSPTGGDAVQMGELCALLAKRIERATSPHAALGLSFQLAALLAELGQGARARDALLELGLAERAEPHPGAPHARVRSAERAASSRRSPACSREQGEQLRRRARAPRRPVEPRGARGVEAPGRATRRRTYRRILELDPTDPGALEATVRRDLPHARRGDPRRARRRHRGASGARRACVRRRARAWRSSSASRSPRGRGPGGRPTRASARRRWRRRSIATATPCRIDELSVTAATGLARLADPLHDDPAPLSAAAGRSRSSPSIRASARGISSRRRSSSSGRRTTDDSARRRPRPSSSTRSRPTPTRSRRPAASPPSCSRTRQGDAPRRDLPRRARRGEVARRGGDARLGGRARRPRRAARISRWPSTPCAACARSPRSTCRRS